MSNPIVIGLTGKARSGKDTVADYLVYNYGFKKYSIANAVKDAALAVNPIVYWDKFSDKPVRLAQLISAVGWEIAKDTYPEVRSILQLLGTEAGWKMHGQDMWTRRTEQAIRNENDPRTMRVVISDIRFPHEIDMLRSLSEEYLVARVERDNVGISGTSLGQHESENNEFPVDFHIMNDGSLGELSSKVDFLVSGIEGGDCNDVR